MSQYVQTVVCLAAILMAGRFSAAQDAGDDEAAEKSIAERFAVVLEKNPRRGTAFDKVYGYHVEHGSLDSLLKKYQQKGSENPGTDAASAWMIVGLIEMQRGREAEAIRAFARAETLDPANAMASYQLGQALVQAGQSDPAAEAFERAIQRKPAAADLLEAFQALGRVYQRAQKSNKALDVWNRLEQQFPNDARVQEQIATTLLEENDFAAALPRFENLARSTKDKFRQSLFQVEAAEIKVRLGKTEDALKDFESLLRQLNPDNWLFRDVRRRIETVFLKGNDQAGLIAYYQTWIDKHPEDLDAMARLARMLAGIGRGREAQAWLQRGLKQAPSRRDLRLALIGQLLNDAQYHEAVQQYEQLDKHEPNNPDTLREWGRVLLKDASLTAAERKSAAAAVWRRLLAARSGDAPAAIQVADLFRRAELTDEAVDLYRRAIEIDPQAGQYREYLGEYLYSLKRTDEAVSAWREIAMGSRKTVPNLARLAEVLAQYGQPLEAIEANAEACRLDPTHLSLRLKQADLLSKAEKHEESLQELAIAEKLVLHHTEDHEAWLRRELAELQALDRLTPRIAEVQKELTARSKSPQDADRWYWLARANEAANQSRDALRAIDTASELNPNSIPILTAAARMNEAQRNLRTAVDLYTKLAVVNRRSRTEYLQRISALEEKLGHREQALQAGRDLLAASPGNPETNDFFAQLCFRLGRHDEGIQALRRSLRANPGDLPTLLKLAAVLDAHRQTSEAVDLLWRAFERCRNLEERLSVVQQLADALGRQGQSNTLYIRLEHARRDANQHREMTLCLARAYETAKDFATAQHKLESLLTDETRDTELLTHLRSLAERQKDLKSAIRFQRQLWEITSHKSDRFHLAQLLLQGGQHDEAVDLLTAESGARELTADVLRLLDGLHQHGRGDEALARLKRLRERFPDNWELLYREGVALGKTSPAAAMERFEAILKLNRPEDEASLKGAPQRNSMLPATATALPLVERISKVGQVLVFMQSRPTAGQGISVKGSNTFNATIAPPVWIPGDYGSARMAAWCWIVNFRRLSPRYFVVEDFPELQHPSSRQQLFDLIVVHLVLDNYEEKCKAARQLMQLSEDDIEAKVLYVKCVLERTTFNASIPPGTPQPPIKRTRLPLEQETLDEVLSIYREIAARADLVPINVVLLSGLISELKMSGRETVAAELLLDAARKATTTIEVAYLLQQQRQSPDLAITSHLLDRLIELQDRPVTGPSSPLQAHASTDRLPQQLLQMFADSSNADDMLAVWSRYVRWQARESSKNPRPAFNRPAPLQYAMTRSNTLLPGQTGTVVATTVVANGQIFRVQSLQGTMTEAPGFLYRPEAASILMLIHRHFDATKRGDELITNFTNELQAEGRTAEERLHWQHALAYVLWIDNKRDESLALLADAVKDWPLRKDLRLGLATQYELAGQPSNALAMLDTVTAESPAEQRQIETMAIRLALAVSQKDRARLAVERLLEGKIPDADSLTLAEQLLQLGLHDKAEAILKQPNNAVLHGKAAQRVLMDIQLAQGKNEEASAGAAAMLEILDRPRVGPTEQMQFINGRQVFVAVENPDALRQHCYKVLRATGRLAEMIDDAEKKLEKSPRSESVIQALINYHTAIGNQPRIDELITHKLKLDADHPAARFALAIRYLKTGKPEAAVEQMKILLEQDPADFGSRCRNHLWPQERENQPEFASLLGKLDWGHSDKRLAELPGLVEQLSKRPDTAEAGKQLFVTLWESRPERRCELLERFSDDRWWQLKQVRDELKSVIVPQSTANVSDQWKIFGRVQGQTTETGFITVWTRLLTDAASQKTLDPMAADVEQGMKQWSEWAGGAVMLAMIDLRRGRIDAGRAALEKLFPELEEAFQSRPLMAWEIAQELALHKESLDLSVKYFTVAIRQAGRPDWQSSPSPALALIDAYVRHDRTPDARKLLLESVPATIRRGANPRVIPSSADVSQVLSITRKLRSLNFPMEAIEIYLAALQRTEGTLIGGYDPSPVLNSALIWAFGELKSDTFVQYLERFDATGPLNLGLFVRQTDPARGRMQCRWDALLTEIARDADLKARAQAAIARICRAQSDTLAPLILSSQLSFAAGDREQAADAVAKLVRLIDKQPLRKESDLAITREQQRLAETDQIALWLVARECLTQPALVESGKKLGRRAIEVSRPISNVEFSYAILTEWIRIADEAGDSVSAARMKAELALLPGEPVPKSP